MGMPSHALPVEKLKGIEEYQKDFKKVFNGEITIDNVARAIAAFERTLLSGNSPFDRYMYGGEKEALNPLAKIGLEVFRGKGGCALCHTIGTDNALFMDNNFHNLGVGMDKPNPGLGRYNVTKQERDMGAFKTPSLRNIALTAPYMHDGSEINLEAVVEFYDKGGKLNPHLSTSIKPLNLTSIEKLALVEFMKSLTSSDIPELTPTVFGPSVSGAKYRLLESFHVVDVRIPSGIAYDPLHDSLWVTEEKSGGGLVEIDKKGNVLKKVPLRFEDVEGIAYKADSDSFLLAEERSRQIVEVDRTGKTLKIIQPPLIWRFWTLKRYGWEGIAYDPKVKSIFVANEKAPCHVLELKEDGRTLNSFDVPQAGDISDLYYDVATDRLLVLSHAGRVLREFTRKGQLLNSFPVVAQHGEAVTKDTKGYLYIICEDTNILYVYAPEVAPRSVQETKKSEG
ncbi:MAG TPA: SdiA-regulated domain-containing protein, partial [Candidatus Hypogeohydataceae bacterium YC40]